MAQNTNTFLLVGRLTADAELRTFGKNGKELIFSMANNRGFGDYAKVYYFDCKLWGKKAENLEKHLLKGTKIALKGEVIQDRWTDNEGKTRSKIRFSGDDVELLSFPDSGGNTGGSQPNSDNMNSNAANGSPANDQEWEDDIPF